MPQSIQYIRDIVFKSSLRTVLTVSTARGLGVTVEVREKMSRLPSTQHLLSVLAGALPSRDSTLWATSCMWS